MENSNRGFNFCISVLSRVTKQKNRQHKIEKHKLKKVTISLINTVISRDRAEIFRGAESLHAALSERRNLPNAERALASSSSSELQRAG